MREYSRTIVRGILFAAVGTLLCVVVAAWALRGENPPLRHELGLDAHPLGSLPERVSVAFSAHGGMSPEEAALSPGGDVTFRNDSNAPILLRFAPLSPARLARTIPAHGSVTVALRRPGLYHYFDERTARIETRVAGNDVVVSADGSALPRQGWISVIPATPGLSESLLVPTQNDLFAPKAVSATVGSTIIVANHDTDAHNLVVDPASPQGAAFIINGTDAESGTGWHRSFVFQQPGIYHLYCTLHTRVVGRRNGWNVVVPRKKASGFKAHNPMEAWVVVLPPGSS